MLSVQHAHALELLSDMMYDGAHVLDVGSGSGYLTACMAMLVIECLFITTPEAAENNKKYTYKYSNTKERQ